MAEEKQKFRKVKFKARINFHSLTNSIQRTCAGGMHEFVVCPDIKIKETFFCRLDILKIDVIMPGDNVDCEILIFGSNLELHHVKVGNDISLFSGKEVAIGKIVEIFEHSEEEISKLEFKLHDGKKNTETNEDYIKRLLTQ